MGDVSEEESDFFFWFHFDIGIEGLFVIKGIKKLGLVSYCMICFHIDRQLLKTGMSNSAGGTSVSDKCGRKPSNLPLVAIIL